MKHIAFRSRSDVLSVAAWAVLAAAAGAGGQATGGGSAGPQPPALMETHSPWRCWFLWQEELVQWESGEITPVRRVKGGEKPIEKVEARAEMSQPPPGDWTAREFDDSDWVVSPGPLVHAPHRRDLAAMCLRGRFELAEPADLSLSLSYRGAAAVYVNGHELARGHLPAGELSWDTPAQAYGREAYVDAEGALLTAMPRQPPPDGMKLRVRGRTWRLPAALLRKGVNVLAIRLHRAATSELLYTAKDRQRSHRGPPVWSMLGFESLSLTGGSAPPAAVRVWPGNPLVDAFDLDGPEVGTAGRPIRVAAGRNGAFSGVLMVHAAGGIRSGKVEPGDLKLAGGKGTIPAGACRVRYGGPGDAPPKDAAGRHPPKARFLGVLYEALPAEAAEGTVLPVWLTVSVGRDARAGLYKGSVRIAVNGGQVLSAPVELSVADFVLSEPKGFASFTGIVESPESVALQYGVPLWSDAHWALLEKVFAHLGPVGVKVVTIPLVGKTNRGNEQSMVRWVRQADGSWKHDFGIVERYLDLAVRHLGKVPIVCWHVWTPSHGGGAWGKLATDSKPEQEKPPVITVLDPATGQVQEASAPAWGSSQSAGFWKPVFDGLRACLARRGLEQSGALGLVCDFNPDARTVGDLKAAAPHLRWVVHGHGLYLTFAGEPVVETAHVWGVQEPRVSTDSLRKYGWQNPIPVTVFPRYGAGAIGHVNDQSPLGVYHALTEAYQASGHNGVNDMGADFWPVIQGPRGRVFPVTSRYSFRDRPGPPTMAHGRLVFPAAAGPLATVRLEALRLGNQEAEARIFLEKALLDPARRQRLGPALAGQAQRLLDDRIRRIIRAKTDSSPMYSYGSDASWLDYAAGVTQRASALYEAAAEAARKLGG
jgi:hypothetical protein